MNKTRIRHLNQLEAIRDAFGTHMFSAAVKMYQHIQLHLMHTRTFPAGERELEAKKVYLRAKTRALIIMDHDQIEAAEIWKTRKAASIAKYKQDSMSEQSYSSAYFRGERTE